MSLYTLGVLIFLQSPPCLLDTFSGMLGNMYFTALLGSTKRFVGEFAVRCYIGFLLFFQASGLGRRLCWTLWETGNGWCFTFDLYLLVLQTLPFSKSSSLSGSKSVSLSNGSRGTSYNLVISVFTEHLIRTKSGLLFFGCCEDGPFMLSTLCASFAFLAGRGK